MLDGLCHDLLLSLRTGVDAVVGSVQSLKLRCVLQNHIRGIAATVQPVKLEFRTAGNKERAQRDSFNATPSSKLV
eukprot:3356647-Amphidinium_carterae.1